MSDEFDLKNTGFWGALAGLFWTIRAYFKYKAEKAKQPIDGEMKRMKNIKELMELLEFGFEARRVGMDLFKDGKFNLEAIGALLPLYPKAMAAFDGVGEIPAELSDLDEAESAQLVAYVVGKGVANEHAAAVIAKSLKVGVSVIELVKEIKK